MGSMESEKTFGKLMLFEEATKNLVINQDTFKNNSDPECLIQQLSVL